MARRTVTTTEFTDDLDGTKADRTVTFSFSGVDYEIDLSRSNARAFERAVKPYMEAGRKARTPRKRAHTSATRGRREHLASIRAWAAENNIEVGPRGRIAADVIAAYEAARS
jgi:hypothetical protein